MSPRKLGESVSDTELQRLENKLDLLIRRGAGSFGGAANEPWQQDDTDVNPLWENLRVIRRHKIALFVIVVIGSLAGALLSLAPAPMYDASSSLEISDPAGNLLQTKSLNVSTAAVPPDTYAQTIISLLQSDAVLRQVAAKLGPHGLRQALGAEGFGPLLRSAGLSVKMPVTAEQVSDGLRKNLSVRQVRGTNLVTVQYRSSDPQVASAVVNGVADEYVQQTIRQRVDDSTRTRELLSRELTNLKNNLEESESRLQNYSQASGLLVTRNKDDSVAEDMLRHLESDLSAAKAQRMAKQSQYESLTSAASGPGPNGADPTETEQLREYQAKLTDLRRQLADLNTIYKPTHYKVKETEAQIAELESAVQRERTKLVNRIHTDYETALANERLLTESYLTQAKLVSDEGTKLVRYDVLKREVDTNRSLYDAMLQAVQEAAMSVPLAMSIRVVDPAVPPTSPTRRVWLHAGAGMFAGLLFGVVILLVNDHVHRRVRAPSEIRRYLGLTEVGVIPSFRVLPGVFRPSTNRTLSIAPQRDLAVVEAFRKTLASIVLNDSSLQVILLTSPGPDEGKSTVASSLAIALSELGRRVLLIGADLRRPVLHSAFGIDNQTGLSELLLESGPFDTTPSSGFMPVPGRPGLYILPSGSEWQKASSQLSSPRMADIVKRARNDFDMILIDTPPVLLFADARLLARYADTAILLLRCGRTSLSSALAAKTQLFEDGTPVLGAILNDWSAHKDGARDSISAHKDYSKYYVKVSA